MKMDRLGLLLGTAACLAGLSACKGTRELSDVQLTRLLHVDRVAATDPRAPIDGAAVNCLKAWSGDVELTANLPPALREEAGKNGCKPRVDGWIADAERNPDKIRFEELAAPPSVRRAAALMVEHRASTTTQLPSMGDKPPAALGGPGQTAPAAPTEPSGPVDLSVATAAVSELDGMCQQAKQAAASGQSTQLARYASYCDKRIDMLRTRISTVMSRGDSRQAQMVNDNAQQLLTVARRIAAQGKAPPPAQNQ